MNKYDPITLSAWANRVLAAKKTDLRYIELVLKVSMRTGLEVPQVEELAKTGVTA